MASSGECCLKTYPTLTAGGLMRVSVTVLSLAAHPRVRPVLAIVALNIFDGTSTLPESEYIYIFIYIYINISVYIFLYIYIYYYYLFLFLLYLSAWLLASLFLFLTLDVHQPVETTL